MDKKGNHHICFGKKGISLLCIAALTVFPFSGCTLKSEYQKEEENTQGELDISPQIELTEEEMDQTHLTMDLREKVKIDAKITPYHLYKDGVSVYYNPDGKTWNTMKLDKKKKDTKIEDLTYLGKSVEEIANILETENGRKPQLEKLDWKFHKKYGSYQISLPFTVEGNEDDVLIEMQWACPIDEEENPLLNSKTRYSYFNITSETGTQAQRLASAVQLLRNASYDVEQNLSFADSEATAQMLKEMLTELTGYEYSEDYDVIPMDSTVIEDASKNTEQIQQETGEEYNTLLAGIDQIKPCYYYCFYQELDGLPLRNSSQYILADEETNLSEELRNELEGQDMTPVQIDNYCSPYAEIIYDETGIIFLQFGNDFVSDTGLSGEKEPVCNLSDILEPLYEHFDSVASIDTTVYEIRLGYRASFTDDIDEPIQKILTPVWIVKYDTQMEGKRSEVVCFDGYTGMPLEHVDIY